MALAPLALVYDMQLDTKLRLPLQVMKDRLVEHHPERVEDTRPHHQDQILLCLSKTASHQQTYELAPGQLHLLARHAWQQDRLSRTTMSPGEASQGRQCSDLASAPCFRMLCYI